MDSNLWSCCRYNSNNAWYANGGNGFFNNGNFYNRYRAVPVSLLIKDNPIIMATLKDLMSELQYLLRMSVYFNPRAARKKSPASDWERLDPNKSLLNKPDGIGAAPGKIIMQMAMTYYHDEVIKWLLSMGVRPVVYGDDFGFVFRDKTQFLGLIMPEFRERMKAIGCTLHPRKFYCQHFTKGVRFCSQFIKMQRVYTGNRAISNLYEKIAYWNKHVSLRNMDAMLSCVNSYLGMMRNRNSYGLIRQAVNAMNPAWFKYVELGDKNTLTARKGYRRNDVICKISKIKRHDKKRKGREV